MCPKPIWLFFVNITSGTDWQKCSKSIDFFETVLQESLGLDYTVRGDECRYSFCFLLNKWPKHGVGAQGWSWWGFTVTQDGTIICTQHQLLRRVHNVQLDNEAVVNTCHWLTSWGEGQGKHAAIVTDLVFDSVTYHHYHHHCQFVEYFRCLKKKK